MMAIFKIPTLNILVLFGVTFLGLKSYSDVVLFPGQSALVGNERVFCQGYSDQNCAGRMAAKRPYWNANDLRVACEGAGGDCVVGFADSKPYWNAIDLNIACRNDYTNCAGRLQPIKQYWNPVDLNHACNGADGTCVVDLAQSRPYWGPQELNNACHL